MISKEDPKMEVPLSALALFGLVSGQKLPTAIKTNRAEIVELPFRDVVELDHDNVVREFENEKVRILHFHLKGDALDAASRLAIGNRSCGDRNAPEICSPGS